MKNIIIVLIALLLFPCCDNNNNEVIEHNKDCQIKIEAYYKLLNADNLYPDKDADIFVYYGIVSMSITGYSVNDDGVLTFEGKNTINPNKCFKADQDGKYAFISERPEDEITIIIRSNYFKNLFSIDSYPNSKSDIKIKSIANE